MRACRAVAVAEGRVAEIAPPSVGFSGKGASGTVGRASLRGAWTGRPHRGDVREGRPGGLPRRRPGPPLREGRASEVPGREKRWRARSCATAARSRSISAADAPVLALQSPKRAKPAEEIYGGEPHRPGDAGGRRDRGDHENSRRVARILPVFSAVRRLVLAADPDLETQTLKTPSTRSSDWGFAAVAAAAFAVVMVACVHVWLPGYGLTRFIPIRRAVQ